MEEAEDENTEPTKVGYSQGFGLPMGEHKVGLLENFSKSNFNSLDYKRKARNGRVL